MNDLDLKELASVPGLSYEQRSTLQERRSMIEAQAKLLEAQTAHVEAMKSLPPESVEALKPPPAPREWKHSFPFWMTIWGVYFTAWIFLMMVYRSNVYPLK